MFAVVYAIFLAAFSVLIRGSMPYSYDEVSPPNATFGVKPFASHPCVLRQCNGGPDDPEPYKCWTM